MAHSGVAYSEFCNDETANTAIGFLYRATQWLAERGAMIEAVMTDDAPGHRSNLFCDTLDAVGIDHLFTKAYRPQTNGKVLN